MFPEGKMYLKGEWGEGGMIEMHNIYSQGHKLCISIDSSPVAYKDAAGRQSFKPKRCNFKAFISLFSIQFSLLFLSTF